MQISEAMGFQEYSRQIGNGSDTFELRNDLPHFLMVRERPTSVLFTDLSSSHWHLMPVGSV